MKIAYFDCFAGICGNMVLGAMVDAGLDFEWLGSEIAKLNVDDYKINHEKVRRGAISGTKVSVETKEQVASRGLSDIKKIVTEQKEVVSK